MAADFIRAIHGKRQTLDDLMGDDTAIFRDVMSGPARQPVDNSRSGFTRPEDHDPNSDAAIFDDIMEGRNKPSAAPPRFMGRRDQFS